MEKTTENIGLLKDSALDKPENDKLGYSDFSKDIACFIQNKVPPESFVISIYGSWGSGKSTILNFIEYHLNQQENPPIIIKFNPWWFSDQEDLIGKYLSELESSLGQENKFEDLKEKIQKYSHKLVSNVPTSTPQETIIKGILAKIIKKLTESKDTTLDELKNGISNSLNDLDQQIIVLIDDIDRLTENEISQMFKLVKSVADFPNITYVMAFDQDVVINALDNQQVQENGEEYLNKIIQLPQHIPIPKENSLNSMLSERLDPMIEDDSSNIDERRLQGVYSKGIIPLIETPRDVVRFSNAIDTFYSRIGEEVNFIDLLGIEALRIFYRPVYEKIRNNQDSFVIPKQEIEIEDGQFSFLDELYTDLSKTDRDQIKSIVGRLFPHYGTSADIFPKRDISQLRRQKRICHPDMFPYYFRQTIPHGELTTSEMDSMLTKTQKPDIFSEKLLEFSNQEGRNDWSKANTFLKRFENHLDEISKDEVSDLLLAFFHAGDELISTDPSRSAFDNSSRGIIFRIVLELLKKLDRDKRYEVLDSAIENGNSIYLSFYFIGVMMQEHGKYSGEKMEKKDRTFTWEKIENLQETTVEKAKFLAESGDLLEAPKLDFVLKRWCEWGDKGYVKGWSKETFQNDENLIGLLRKMIQVGRSSNPEGVVEIEYINPENLEPYLEISFVKDRLKEINKDKLDESGQKALEEFENGVERMEEGMDPGNFTDWYLGEKRGDTR